MPYIVKKGFSNPKQEKTKREMYLTQSELQDILREIREADRPQMRRDHCGVYLGFYFGLRVGEVCILNRETFRSIDQGVAYIRTLKQIERIPFVCTSCHRRCRVSAKKIGKEHTCSNCMTVGNVPRPKKPVSLLPPERVPPVIESKVIDYIESYTKDVMRLDQQWLLESNRKFNGKPDHLHPCHLARIFTFYTQRAGIPPIYSWHSLRHGRGVLLWERFKDQVLVKESLRQKSLATSEFYMHLSEEAIEENRKVLDTVAFEDEEF